MFATAEINWRYVCRSLGRVVRRGNLDELSRIVPINVLEELAMYGMDPEWESRDCPVSLDVRQLTQLAEAMGFGLMVEIGESEDLDEWAMQTKSEDLLPARQTKTPCLICRHPRVTEMEILLAKGLSLTKLSKIFGVSTQTIVRHRDLCAGPERIRRLQEAFGVAGDVEALVGSVTKVDQVLELGHRAAEAALAGGQLSDTNTFINTLLQGNELRAKLTGELSSGEPQADGGPAGASNGKVQVFVVPRLPGPEPKIIEGRVDD